MKKFLLKDKHRSFIIVFLIFYFIIHYFSLGNYFFNHEDEPKYINAVNDMYESGDYFLPKSNGNIRINKPLGLYWLIALNQSIMGKSLVTARAISLYFAILLLWTTYLLAIFLFEDKEVAVLSVLLLASSFILYPYLHFIVPEVAFVFLMTLTHFCFLSFVKATLNNGYQKKYIFLFYISMALAFNVKGIFAIVLPFLTIQIYCFLRRDFQLFRKICNPSGILLLMVLILPWYMFLAYKFGPDSIYHLFQTEIAHRITSKKFGLDYYVVLTIFAFFPWSIVVIEKFLRDLFKKRLDVANISAVNSYLFIWFTSHLLFFTFVVGEKRFSYILELSVPLTLLCVKSILTAPRFTYRISNIIVILCLLLIITLFIIGWLYLGDIFANPVSIVLQCSLLVIGVGVAIYHFNRHMTTRSIIFTTLLLLMNQYVFFHKVIPTTQLNPLALFAKNYYSKSPHSKVIMNSNGFYEVIPLYNIKYSEIELINNIKKFYQVLKENNYDYAMFNHHLLNGLPKEIKGEYDVVDVGYKFRVEDGYKSFKKFLKNKNNGYILEKIFLLKKKFNSSKRGDTPKSLRHKESRREGFNNAVDEKP